MNWDDLMGGAQDDMHYALYDLAKACEVNDEFKDCRTFPDICVRLLDLKGEAWFADFWIKQGRDVPMQICARLLDTKGEVWTRTFLATILPLFQQRDDLLVEAIGYIRQNDDVAAFGLSHLFGLVRSS